MTPLDKAESYIVMDPDEFRAMLKYIERLQAIIYLHVDSMDVYPQYKDTIDDIVAALHETGVYDEA
jgi:hypothetical protein